MGNAVYKSSLELGGEEPLTRGYLGDFITLAKPGVLFLVVYTAFVGLILAPGNKHPFISVAILLSIALASGGAAAFNMWYDRDMDAVMPRTQKRPIPMGHVSPSDTLIFATLLSGSSLLIMALTGSYLATFWLAFSIFFYSFVYTVLLKRTTPQNIVIGGAAGAFPPVIAWIGQTDHLSLMPLILFLIIFLWTPSHFWALALYRSNDYARVNVPMLPVTHGVSHTVRQIFIYSLLLMSSSYLPLMIPGTGMIYCWAATLLGIPYVALAAGLWARPSNRLSMTLFTYSIFYLFLLFTALVIDFYI